MRLDDLARTATEMLLADTTPDTEARLADLKRTRRNRSVTRTVAASVALVAVIGGWAALRDDDGKPEPAEPTYRNGALVLVDDRTISQVPGQGDPIVRPTDAARFTDLEFTSDGSEIVYVDRDDRVAGLDVTTGETRGLGVCLESGCMFALSPDGRSLVVANNSGARLHRVAEAGDGTRLATGPMLDPDWSPDGRSIVFTDGFEILTVSQSGDDLRSLYRVAEGKEFVHDVEWSPDGTSIAFIESHNLDGRAGYARPREHLLRVLDVASGEPPRTLEHLGLCHCVGLAAPSLAWAPDGSGLAVTTIVARRRNVAAAHPGELAFVTLEGSAQVLAGTLNGHLAWQPVPVD